MNIRVEGLGQVEEGLNDLVKSSKVAANQGLMGIAREFRKKARARTPDSGKASKQKLKRKYYIKTVEKTNNNVTVMVGNSAPHYHLVERGHELVLHGKPCGFVEGQHMFERTVDEFEHIMPQELEDMIGKAIDKF